MKENKEKKKSPNTIVLANLNSYTSDNNRNTRLQNYDISNTFPIAKHVREYVFPPLFFFFFFHKHTTRGTHARKIK